MFLGASEFKIRNLIWNGSFCNLCALALVAGVTYLRYIVLTSPNKGETAVHCCDPPLSVLVILVSRNVCHVVSALQSIVFILFWGADQVSCRSYVGSAYRTRSLAVSHWLKFNRKNSETTR